MWKWIPLEQTSGFLARMGGAAPMKVRGALCAFQEDQIHLTHLNWMTFVFRTFDSMMGLVSVSKIIGERKILDFFNDMVLEFPDVQSGKARRCSTSFLSLNHSSLIPHVQNCKVDLRLLRWPSRNFRARLNAKLMN